MKRILVGFIICFLFWNCGKKEEKIVAENKPYIISYEDTKLEKYYDSIKTNTNKYAPPPRKSFYGESQLIIDQKGDLFFYQQEYIGYICGTDSENDSIPYFRDLKPKDIIRIPQESLNNFISENILTKEKNRQILIIASQNDTIKNEYFLKFLKSNIIQTYHIRRTTQEEDTVIFYKKNNKYYDSDSIKWDKTKIKFPEYLKFVKRPN
ncbi:hypothetical protein GON26_15400 [Flavobacterium sp. GA093]|uniref:Uncharacterized protein n=1 Tax=Flavobacterium hydrocarbonoxydans TaxID=2683249 RepID=A0A6I4NNN1_9FLAO|nr:hypothetical protein [Flavobacterium hydrocarbonoxydans]MWB95753.1 hypothetical protein [Flavobacterium hydrocarbonoxydans]